MEAKYDFLNICSVKRFCEVKKTQAIPLWCGLVCTTAGLYVSTICQPMYTAKLIRVSCTGYLIVCIWNVPRSASPKYLLMSGNWQEVPHAAWSRSAIMYNADAWVRGRQKSRHSGLRKGDFHPNSWSRGLIGRRSSAFLPPLFLPYLQMRLGRFKETWYLVARVTRERS